MTVMKTSNIVYFLGNATNRQKIADEDVLLYQRLLKTEGLYEGKLDSLWGKKTNRASIAFMEATKELESELGSFDARSEKYIRSLCIAAQIEARLFLQRLEGFNYEGSDFTVKIICGTRTYTQQAELYAQGRTKPGHKVTWVKPGWSYHNFGLAWDIGVFGADGAYLTKADIYDHVAEIALDDMSTEWGGSWKRYRDRPHYQLATSMTKREIRQSFARGENVITSPIYA